MLLTANNLKKLNPTSDEYIEHFDIVVVGGGINGSGIARDAAGRGLKVLLLEKGDWASSTSSASTKLIHGGLRYLENYEFSLVKSALHERELLYKSASHMIFPLKFVLPHNKQQRPRWMIRLGLFLYDYLGRVGTSNSSFEKSGAISLATHPLAKQFKHGFVYTDCMTDDARLVISNVIDASERGAITLARSALKSLAKNSDDNMWDISFNTKLPWQKRAKRYKVKAKVFVNAAGTHVNDLFHNIFDNFKPNYNMRLVKGSHIVVPKLYNGSHAYILQNDDDRIVFAIPYQKDFTLIGTTDVLLSKNPKEVKISEKEKDYLCSVINKYFVNNVAKSDIIWSYSGIRPLLDDGSDKASAVTRDYKIDVSYIDELPVLSIYGGKITTFRKLSEKVVNIIANDIFNGQDMRAWTTSAKMVGGDLSGAANFDLFLTTLKREFYWLPDDLAERYARAYGSRVRVMLRGCSHIGDMREDFGSRVFAKEIEYLIEHEDAMSIDDIIWRRSKIGLYISDETKEKIAKFIEMKLYKKQKVSTKKRNRNKK